MVSGLAPLCIFLVLAASYQSIHGQQCKNKISGRRCRMAKIADPAYCTTVAGKENCQKSCDQCKTIQGILEEMQKMIDQQGTQITGLLTTNNQQQQTIDQQGTQITDLLTIDTQQEESIIQLETKDTAQEESIIQLETKNTAQDVTIASQGDRITALEPVCHHGFEKQGARCYKTFTEKKNLADATAACLEIGAILAEPNSQQKNTELRTLVGNKGLLKIWIGLTDIASEGNFKWQATGLGPTWTDWGSNEPNDLHGAEDCTELFTNRWNDAPCDRVLDYVCQKPLVPVSLEEYNCQWTGYLNEFDALLKYTVPTGAVVKGVESYHDHSTEDRRWKVYYCYITTCAFEGDH